MGRVEAPGSAQEAAEVLRAAGADGQTVRVRGGGTKMGWGKPAPPPDVELSTAALNRILEHNAADLTAELEAGVPLGEAQAAFARAGQMLALDPPPSFGQGLATVGGVVAAADSGPLRHRFGGPRDLLIGITVALPDGILARSGGKVIKNVAGYDLAKLYSGSFGTLGAIVRVAVRLHPLPPARATAVGASADPGALERAALALAHAPLELEALDLRWEGEEGRVLARCAGAAAWTRAGRAAGLMSDAGLEPQVVEDDEDLWRRQREDQRSADGLVVRVSTLPAELARVVGAARRLGAAVVGRAGLGLFWLRLPATPPEDLVASVEEVRGDLAPAPCVVLDAPAPVREKLDPWGEVGIAELALMRRVKRSFDPGGVCAPGLFVGGI